MSDRIRLVLADDHPIFLAGLRSLLELENDFEVVGEAMTGTATLRAIAEQRPDVAIIDVSMPELNGIALARRLSGDRPATRILMLTLHEERAYLQQALQAGARGYVLKRSASGILVPAIRAIMAAGIFVDPAIAGRMFDPQSGGLTQFLPEAVALDLTAREVEVLRLIAAGFTNKEIAHRLGVGVKSVETFKARAVDKLGLRNRADIVRYAILRGWLAELDSLA